MVAEMDLSHMIGSLGWPVERLARCGAQIRLGPCTHILIILGCVVHC